jgi:hypothetical protein
MFRTRDYTASAIKTSADLMTLCLFHPLNGVPLMAVSTAAFALKTGDFSDAAKPAANVTR